MSKIKDIEKRLKILENRLQQEDEEDEELRDTSSPIGHFFFVLVIGWLPVLIGIVLLFYRFFNVMFMSRHEQTKHKESYLDGSFNALSYILDGEVE